ncbi:MAG: hypothetical protein NDI61_03635 [Bdellovibrionaceae bacterium]|nr:hypothetical protein [Pseudobdellovibrionaceae bacterium]
MTQKALREMMSMNANQATHPLARAKCLRRPRASNAQGFSMVELIVAVGVAVTVVLIASSVLYELQNSSNRLRKAMDQEIDFSIGIREMVNLLRKSALSYNNLIVQDDNGRNFFDLITDITATQIPDISARSRRLTLSLAPGGITQLVFIFNDDPASQGFLYNPIDAYNVGPPPGNLDVSGAINYRGINADNVVAARAPGVWRQGNLVLLFSPIPLREMIGGTVDVFTPPRNAIYFGRVRGDDVEHVSLGGLIRNTHPAKASLVLDSGDKFFRNLPSIGGSSPMVILQPVGLLRFYLMPTTVSGAVTGRLITQTYSEGAWSDASVVFPDIKGVVFKRELISTPQISIQVIPR